MALWEIQMMANVAGIVGASMQDSSLLLHPELLSRDFLLLSLEQKNIPVEDGLHSKERLTEIFVQHAMPLPQRDLPKSRWGKSMKNKRADKKISTEQKSTGTEILRKRPLIVFDGSSTSTSIKLKRIENDNTSHRLKHTSEESANDTQNTSPSPRLCLTTPTRETKLITVGNGQHDNSPVTVKTTVSIKSAKLIPPTIASAVKIKRAAPKEESDIGNDTKPTEAKKKIQHITWP
ncbi:hypothetical protein GDO86_003887 [Hymenochirus boettgeri]|uniref:Ashwin n=1 Tax=Hymenochirus boettgeri TaxID=247094 RepID=A0A8T2K897_9PIPI|nr:hypothetical protein GDO86_003887 [Hymenochirus boettgeri]